MSNIDGSYSGDLLGNIFNVDPLTPEQLGQIDPAVLAASGTPGSVQVVQPIYKVDDKKVIDNGSNGATTAETLEEKNARLAREQQQAQYDETKANRTTDAYARLRSLLSDVGLSGLEKNVQDLIARGISDGDSILFELRDTAEFKERFKGNAARKAAGIPELAPLVYVALEQKYRDLLKANGFNADVYNDKEDYAKLIGGDVSLAELQVRVEEGYNAVEQADPEVIRQMEELYKVSKADLAHYFLDPSKTAPQLKQQAKAANIAARAKEQGKMQLTSVTAEELVSRGYTESQAQQAFTMLSEGAGLYNEMTGEATLTADQKIGSAFGYDTNSKEAIQKRASVRKAAMSRSSKFTSTTGATSGTTETGLNVAQ